MNDRPHRVTGIGGIFFKATDPAALGAWYRTHLGIGVEAWGGTAFSWREDDAPERKGSTVWSPFKPETTYFAPSDKPFMVNYRVDDLDAVRAALIAEGVEVDAKVDDSDYGRFGWLMDPDGNRIELWQPPVPPRPDDPPGLAGLHPDWRVDDGKLCRSWKFENFAAALAFVERVAAHAERLNHHPEITFGWGYARIALHTHATQTLTEADVQLAAALDGSA